MKPAAKTPRQKMIFHAPAWTPLVKTPEVLNTTAEMTGSAVTLLEHKISVDLVIAGGEK